ncbi:upf0586 protein c9orf41 homolog [Phtheirospermum japonicum]|uniref:Upf0586 protein c9orf41 homolog n=1 Tax=Phtheirospermum japonicum TaxID=374723 RepID=A0A830D603_9LAMI|nr:upf0586 protein c9orf41 homolog [Phtheirospermum japonicum]
MSSIEDEELRRRELEEALEVKSLRRIISAYLNYPEAAEEDIRRYERCFRKLSIAHKVLLSHLPQKFQKLRWCVSQNSYFIFEMLKAFEPPIDMSMDIDISKDQTMENVSDNRPLSTELNLISCQSGSKSGKLRFAKADEFSSGDDGIGSDGSFLKPETVIEEKTIEHKNENADANGFQSVKTSLSSTLECDGHVSSASPDWLNPSLQFHVPLVDVDKVRCIIRNIVRDWALEGQRERDECYKPILNELERLFPHRSTDSPPACLVPGAGLGRLALEISCLDNDQLRPASIPDIHPASAGITEGFSMCGGDFVEVYSDPSQVGLDKFGSLLYHFADTYNHDDEMSIELSLEDVKRAAFHYGFEIEKESTISTTYTTNVRSMMQNRYYAAFWTMRKKPLAGRSAQDAT